MADPISITSSVIGVLSLGINVTRQVANYTREVKSAPYPNTAEANLRNNYGRVITFLVKVLLPDAFRQVQLIQDRIFPSDDEVTTAFRKSYISDCNMTAVAGAIIAQVAITALSLPSLDQTHWVARAFFLASLISGCLSVYFACLLQRNVGALYRPCDVRDWLTRPTKPQDIFVSTPTDIEPAAAAAGVPVGVGVSASLSRPHLAEREKKCASLFSALVLTAPSSMINIALGAFLLGLGIYLGFLWTKRLDISGGTNDSRDVFIIFLVSTFLVIAIYAMPSAYKNLEMNYHELVKIDSIQVPAGFAQDSSERLRHDKPSQQDIIQALVEELRQTNRAQQDSIAANRQLAAEISKLAAAYGSGTRTNHPAQDHEQISQTGATL